MENYERCWPHRCMHMGEENIMVLLKNPTASGQPRAIIMQKRAASAQRAQKLITHQERARSQIHLKRHERLGNRRQCFAQEATNRETSSRVLRSNVLIRPRPEGWSHHRRIISKGTRRGLKIMWGGRVSWDDRVVEPSKDRVERHCE